jgi:hypothetical protein
MERRVRHRQLKGTETAGPSWTPPRRSPTRPSINPEANVGKIRARVTELTVDQTTAFFATPVGSASDLRTVFVAAFTASIEAFYGPATVASV